MQMSLAYGDIGPEQRLKLIRCIPGKLPNTSTPPLTIESRFDGAIHLLGLNLSAARPGWPLLCIKARKNWMGRSSPCIKRLSIATGGGGGRERGRSGVGHHGTAGALAGARRPARERVVAPLRRRPRHHQIERRNRRGEQGLRGAAKGGRARGHRGLPVAHVCTGTLGNVRVPPGQRRP